MCHFDAALFYKNNSKIDKGTRYSIFSKKCIKQIFKILEMTECEYEPDRIRYLKCIYIIVVLVYTCTVLLKSIKQK